MMDFFALAFAAAVAAVEPAGASAANPVVAPAARPAISPHQEKVAFILLEKMGKGRFEHLDRIYAPGFRAHAGDRSVDLDGDNESGRAIRTAVPDLEVAIVRMVEDGDFVAVHWRAKGTNRVAAAGMPGKGARLTVDGMTFFRFEGERIIEEWSLTDTATMMRQLSQ